MVDSRDTIDPLCAACGASLGGQRYVQSESPGWASFCSETCLREAQAVQRKRRWRTRRRAMKVALIGASVAGACLAPHQGREGLRPVSVARGPRQPTAADAAPAVPAGWFGPEWPPTDTSLLAALGRDAWIHPLAGPVPPHAPQRYARVRRRAARRPRGRMPQRPLRRRSGRRDLGRAHPRRPRRRGRIRSARGERAARRRVRAHRPPRRHRDHAVLPPGRDPALDRAWHAS